DLLKKAHQDVELREQQKNELDKKLQQYREEKSAQFLEAQKQIQTLQDEKEAESKKTADEKAEQAKVQDRQNADRKLIEEKYKLLESKVPQTDYLAHDQPKGRIVSLDRAGD